MFTSVRGRLFVILGLAAACLGYLNTNGIKLGLDLQGGMHLVLEIDDPEGTLDAEARADAIGRAERILRTRIDQFGFEEPLIQRVGQERLIVELAGVGDEQRAKDLIQQSAFLEFKLVRPASDLSVAVRQRLDRQIVAVMGEEALAELGQTVSAPSQDLQQILFGGRADSTGADTTQATADSATAEDQAPNLQPFSALLNTGDRVGVFLVAEEDVATAKIFMDLDEFQRALPRGVELVWHQNPTSLGARVFRQLFVLEEDAFLTGEQLESAVAERDPQFNQAQVQFQLNRAGGRRFSNFTAAHVGDYIAIVLDGEVMSAPEVRDRIGATGVIEMGNSDLTEAADLALVLRAGALPAPLAILEERTVGPSLGQDSIDQGKMAGIVGLLAVVIIMIGYYRMAGVIAVLALGFYVLLVMGGLAALKATLTLPGIAGLILTVGMAVDANVLIFERIREELALGRAARTAVDEGFAQALSAIVDANLTTLITALILFQFGTGPVRGFASTLSIGIVASFFSALYVTRTFFLIYLSSRKASDPISI